jgi:hypothetical protein
LLTQQLMKCILAKKFEDFVRIIQIGHKFKLSYLAQARLSNLFDSDLLIILVDFAILANFTSANRSQQLKIRHTQLNGKSR